MSTTIQISAQERPVQILQVPLLDGAPLNGAEFSEMTVVPPWSIEEIRIDNDRHLQFKELPVPDFE